MGRGAPGPSPCLLPYGIITQLDCKGAWRACMPCKRCPHKEMGSPLGSAPWALVPACLGPCPWASLQTTPSSTPLPWLMPSSSNRRQQAASHQLPLGWAQEFEQPCDRPCSMRLCLQGRQRPGQGPGRGWLAAARVQGRGGCRRATALLTLSRRWGFTPCLWRCSSSSYSSSSYSSSSIRGGSGRSSSSLTPTLTLSLLTRNLAIPGRSFSRGVRRPSSAMLSCTPPSARRSKSREGGQGGQG
ncbi:hypothetical protein V8C86DRAFT_2505316, partial [Haematococcus lacustris]